MSAALYHLLAAVEHSRKSSRRTQTMVAEAVSRYIWLTTLERIR